MEVDYERREAPQLVRFKTGDKIEGVLMGREKIRIADKPVIRYKAKLTDGRFVCFLGAAQIIDCLRQDDLGKAFRIHCIGEDVTVKKGENCMKVFEIDVSRTPIMDPDSLEISDADIPF
jgi:hypothetical protein